MTQLQNGLYLHQVDGIKFLTQHGRAILADDMGLGKTRQAVIAMNRPRDLFNLLRAVGHPSAHSFLSFAKRYCGAYKNDFGWVTEDASNSQPNSTYMGLKQLKLGPAFSDVLRKWGLEPRAPLIDQFLPAPGRDFETFQSLSDPAAKLEVENR